MKAEGFTESEIDRATAQGLMLDYPGWRVYAGADHVHKYAVRTGFGPHEPLNPEDEVWARTVWADNWKGLAVRLAEQRDNDQRQALDRIMIFRMQHPDIKISEPRENASGMWEVSEPNRATQAFHSPTVLIRDLEQRYPVAPAPK